MYNGLTSDPEPDQHIKKSELVKEVKVEMSQQDTEDDNDLSKKVSCYDELRNLSVDNFSTYENFLNFENISMNEFTVIDDRGQQNRLQIISLVFSNFS